MGKLESHGDLGAETGPADARGGAELRFVGAPGKPLTRAQKRFDRLLRKVESLRAERVRATLQWERFVQTYREVIHPEERRMSERRKDVVLLLAAHWRKPKGLGKRQRECLNEFLGSQLGLLVELGPDLVDEELRQLWDDLRASMRGEGAVEGAAGEAAESPGAAEDGGEPPKIPPHIVELIHDLGLDPAGFKAGMAEPELLAELERQMGEKFGGAEDRGGRGLGARAGGEARAKSARQEAAERQAAEKAAAREEARKRTVVGIYKQLAKVLHPDLERDPAQRERKQALMQELTKAHREGDLHTLLRLELEWIEREEGDLERLGDEKLGIYSELLEEQVEELQAEIRDLPCAPRFAVVARFARPFGDGHQNVESVLLSIRQVSEALRRLRDKLRGPEAKQAVREVLQEVAEERREEARWESFHTSFVSRRGGGGF
jgi:hypothetical protein